MTPGVNETRILWLWQTNNGGFGFQVRKSLRIRLVCVGINIGIQIGRMRVSFGGVLPLNESVAIKPLELGVLGEAKGFRREIRRDFWWISLRFLSLMALTLGGGIC